MRPPKFISTHILRRCDFNTYLQLTHRAISGTPIRDKKHDQLPPRPSLPDEEIKHAYLKGSGPGGQKINKTSSAVQLTHLPTGVVVKSQATRSRSQNHTIARRILAEKIELIEKGSESRVAKKIERAQKKKASASKKTRRKYRRLEDGKSVPIQEGGDVVGSLSTGMDPLEVLSEDLEHDEDEDEDEVEVTLYEVDDSHVTSQDELNTSAEDSQHQSRAGNEPPTLDSGDIGGNTRQLPNS